MKKRIVVIVSLLVGMAVLFSATTALAEKPPKTVGERIFLVDGSTVFSAGEAFHIMHGFQWIYWITEPIGNGFALSKMTLEVDGVEVDPDCIDIEWAALPEYGLKGFSKLYTFNFPDGMIGEHTFVRRYYFTCQSALKAGELVICEHPTDLIEDLALMQTLVVNFVE